ncbi:MAG: M48 family metalloprotease [Cellvibrionaceae bacterium]
MSSISFQFSKIAIVKCLTLRSVLYTGVGALIILASGCVTNPVTGKSELSLMSEQQEIAMGKQNYLPSQQSQGGLYVVDPALQAYVSSVGQKIAQISHRPELPYEFVVLNNGVPNAWAMPGGKIAINRGLLVQLKDEAQLASVLGHEVVHVTARHAANQMTQSTLLGVGTQVLGVATRESELNQLVMMGAGYGAAAWQAKYGRDDELQSDKIGMNYMVTLGYDPQAAVELQELFVKMSEGKQTDFISGLFASHPPSQQRVVANRERAKKLSGNKRNKAAFDKAMAQLRKDSAAYTTHERAIAAAKNKDMTTAMKLVEQAISQQPKENLFWETKARLHTMQKQETEALRAYDNAIRANPNYFSPYLGRGALKQSMKDYTGAERDLVNSQRFLNTPVANYLLGGVALQQGNRQKAVKYFQVAASAGGEVGQAAQQELAKLNPTPAAQ